jgi:hypothetical protein
MEINNLRRSRNPEINDLRGLVRLEIWPICLQTQSLTTPAAAAGSLLAPVCRPTAFAAEDFPCPRCPFSILHCPLPFIPYFKEQAHKAPHNSILARFDGNANLN